MNLLFFFATIGYFLWSFLCSLDPIGLSPADLMAANTTYPKCNQTMRKTSLGLLDLLFKKR
ncbi:hypothetical protein HBZS_115270 [Helicobacter bizzozeronii CCUG 35545]|nr:hypothetical protein HBZS_115270 [Helicobacter bizzozeronii CCUG 35545]